MQICLKSTFKKPSEIEGNNQGRRTCQSEGMIFAVPISHNLCNTGFTIIFHSKECIETYLIT